MVSSRIAVGLVALGCTTQGPVAEGPTTPVASAAQPAIVGPEEAPAPPPKSGLITFSGGRVVFEGQALDVLRPSTEREGLAELARALSEYLAQPSCAPSCTVEVEIEPDLPYGQFVRVVDTAHKAGVQQLTMRSSGQTATLALQRLAANMVTKGGSMLALDVPEEGIDLIGYAGTATCLAQASRRVRHDISRDELLLATSKACGPKPCSIVLVAAPLDQSMTRVFHAISAAAQATKAEFVFLTPTNPTRDSLPPELIQAIVRHNYGRLRRCYEAGLAAEPELRGKVVVRFVIELDGQVRQAELYGSDSQMVKAGVGECVRQKFERLRFPRPAKDTVTVVYPVIFAPG